MLTIHKASAGSGKTYSLTYTYIKLLLGNKDPMTGRYSLVKSALLRHRAILAITFTNKATEEMKSRIIKRLTELAMRQSCEYEDALCREFGCRLSDLQDRARQALGSLLADYSQFNVNTIDSFFQSVLRSFARELNVSATYEVDIDSERAISIGVKEMLSSINRTSEHSPQWKRIRLLTKWLSDYMEEQLARGNSINVFRPSQGSDRMVQFISDNLDETYRLNVDEIKNYTCDIARIQRFNNALASKIKAIENKLSTLTEALHATMSEYGFDAANISVNTYKNILRWERGDYEIKSTAMVFDEPIEKRYRKPRRKSDAYDIPPAVDNALCETLRYGVANIPLMNLYRHIRDDLFNFGILADVEQKTSEYLRDNQAILLDNTQSLLRHIISRDETPFIYERLGMQLRHFLIDEFQDTSRLQWLNLSPLVEESVDSGHDDLIIGDEKQSIYRFRNADPQLISTIVPNQFAGRSGIKGNRGGENTNYRSAWHIVGFNNAVFAGIATDKRLLDIYGNVVQTIHNTDLPGYVTMTPYTTDTESFEHMASEIARQLAAGYRQRDIAILADTRAQAYAIVNYLLDRATSDSSLTGLQIVTQEALRIESSPVVRRIISVLRYIDSIQSVNNTTRGRMTPQQQLAAIINRFELLRGRGMKHGDALAAAFTDMAVTLDKDALDIANGDYITLPSMVELIVERFTDITERDIQNIYISAFQDLVSSFSARGARGLHQFIKWWDETGSSKSVDVPEGVDAINVMTIHKSKGLEFACVHIPLFNWPRSSGKTTYSWFRFKDSITGRPCEEFADTSTFAPEDVPPMMPLRHNGKLDYRSLQPQYDEHVHDSMVDTLNKTYVAFTRPVRELIIGYSPKSQSAKEVISALQKPENAYTEMSASINNFTEDTTPLLSPYIDESGIFSFGEPTSPVDKDEESSTLPMPPYVTYSNPEIWKLNTLDGIDDILTARHEGIVLHDIMAGIRHVDDVPRAVRRSVMRGFLNAARCDEMIEAITAAVSAPATIRWFEGYRRVLIERPIVNTELTERFIKSGHKTPHSRPDRIVWLDDGSIEIIDYKFGDDRSSYAWQVREYMYYVAQCFPDATDIRGYLWHPLTGEMRLVETRR